ncbi:hypothetical protein B0H13DRAFT_1898865 [Mycena leptocephala]|nr:hypothetical protein B0H13DRAFT_1898865 [Mycena leptocephala]
MALHNALLLLSLVPTERRGAFPNRKPSSGSGLVGIPSHTGTEDNEIAQRCIIMHRAPVADGPLGPRSVQKSSVARIPCKVLPVEAELRGAEEQCAAGGGIPVKGKIPAMQITKG